MVAKRKADLLLEIEQLKAELAAVQSRQEPSGLGVPKKNHLSLDSSISRKETLQFILNNSPFPIALTRMRNNQLVYVNHAWLKMTGYSSDEVIGKNPLDLSLYVDKDQRNHLIQEIRKHGKVNNFEFQVRKKTGEIVDVLFSSNVIMENGEKSMLSMGVDISEKKQFEKNLSYHAGLLDIISDSVISLDNDFRVASWNLASKRIYGWDKKEVLGKKRNEIFTIEYPHHTREDVLEQLELLGVWQGETKQSHKNGELLDIEATVNRITDAQGETTGYIAINRDITNQKQAKMDLIESEAKFRALFDHGGYAFAVSTNGLTKMVNRAYLDLFGYSDPSELIGNPLTDQIAPQERSRIQEYATRRSKGEGAPEFYETLGHKKDGTIFDMDVRVSTYDFAEKIYTFVILRDTTERRQAEDQIQYQAQLLESVTDAVISTDNEFNIVSWNRAAEKMYGWSTKEVIGHRFGDIVPTNYVDVDGADVLAEYHDTGQWQGEVIQEHKTGTNIIVFSAVTRLKDMSGNPVGAIAVNRDITNIKVAERKIRETEGKFRKVIDQSPVSIQIHDTDGKLIQSNNAYSKLFALSEESLTELYQKYNVRQDEQAKKLGLTPFIEKVFSGEFVIFPPYEYNGLDTLNTLNIDKQISRSPWVQTTGFPLKDDDGNVTNAIFMSLDITERMLAENALRESEEKFSALFHAVPIPSYTWKWDGDDFILSNFNDMAVSFTDGSIANLVGIKAKEMYSDNEQILQDFQTCFRQKSIVIREMDYHLKSTGERKYLNVKYAYVAPDLVMVHTEDFTERRQSEEEIRYKAALLENVSEAFISADNDFRIVTWNDAAERMYGWKAEEVIGKIFPEIVPTRYPDQVREEVLAEFRETGSWQGETIQQTKNGDEIINFSSLNTIFDQNENPIGMVGVNRDITMEKTIGEALSASEAKYRAMYDNALVGLFRVELEEGKIIEANKVSAKIFGYGSTEEFVKEFRSINHYANPDDRSPVLQELKEKGYIDKIEIHSKKKDGTLIWNEASFKVNKDEGFIECVALDITQRKLAEETIKSSQEKLSFLHEIDTAILAAESPHDIASSIVERFRQLLGCQRLVLATLNHDFTKFTLLAFDSASVYKNSDPANFDISKYQDIIQVLSRGEIFKLTEFHSRDELSQAVAEDGIRLIVFLPMIVKDTLIGAITILFKNLNQFTKEDEELALQVANQLAIAIQQTQLSAQVIESRSRLESLAQKVINVQEDERKFISRELHDQSGQVLTALNIQLDQISAKIPDEFEEIRTELLDANQLLKIAMKDLRTLAHGLRPPLLDTFSLGVVLKELCFDFGSRTNLEIEYSEESVPEMSELVKINLYRFTQEALTNVIKHARANRVLVKFFKQNGYYVLRVKDDGIGFVRLNKSQWGIGFENMTERLKLIGGKLEIESGPEQGTQLTAFVPVDQGSI